LSQAALNDVLVDQTRSSLKLSYWSGLNLDEDEDDDEEEEEEVDLEKEDKLHTITIANFIPGAVRLAFPSFPYISSHYPSRASSPNAKRQHPSFCKLGGDPNTRRFNN